MTCTLTRVWTRQASAFGYIRSTRHARVLSSSSTVTITRLAATSRWKVGDLVRLKNDDTAAILGTIEQVRGSGWYTVRTASSSSSSSSTGTALCDDSSSPTMSLRGTQLLAAITEESKAGTMLTTRSMSSSSTSNADDTLLVPPTIYDLDALLHDPPSNVTDMTYMAQLRHFSTYDQWIVFTDLHCAPSTLSTCIEVLETTHALALERPTTGVLFLGDFWHQRGILRVDCLNAVLESLKAWQVPMIMIPGNHDQITLRGLAHSLTPLENAYRLSVARSHDADGGGAAVATSFTTSIPGILVLSHPTKFMNALFIPHMRDAAMMESVLQSPPAQAAEAIFCHADVTGAYMNDLVQSSGGVPPSMFPANKPVYSGHFHKPHVIGNSNGGSAVCIEYLGSPYQVSLSEAQQRKALAVMSARDKWKCVERVPIDLGRRHFKVAGPQELLELYFAETEAIADGAAPVDGPIDEKATVRAGDRVVCSLQKREIDNMESMVGDRIHQLRKAGVSVEIRELMEQPASTTGQYGADLSPVEDLSPKATWKAYLDQEVEREAIEVSSASTLLAAGMELLDSMTDENQELRVDSWQHRTELVLDSVTLEGFGPFRNKQTYPLRDRGLVLLRGNNQDGGADSNGSGKSLLAMSTMWCFTGSLDARPMEDSKVSDIINDDCKTARVTVQGELNGVEFSITRSKTSSKSGLIFLLGGEDASAQSAKETQTLIEEKLGVNSRVLARTVFHGQHSIDDLLEAADTKLKDELSMLVPLSVWQDAAARARKLARAASKQCDEIRGMLKIRTIDLERIQSRVSNMQSDVEAKEREHAADAQLLAGLTIANERLGHIDLDQLDTNVGAANKAVVEISEKIALTRIQMQSEINDLQKDLQAKQQSRAAIEEKLTSFKRDRDILRLKLESATDRLRSLELSWSLDLSDGLVDLQLPESCPTCGQKLDDEHEHQALEDTVATDANAALDAVGQVKSALRMTEIECEASNQSLMTAAAAAEEAEGVLNEQQAYWNHLLAEGEEHLKVVRLAYEDASNTFATAARELQGNARVDELKTKVDRSENILRFAQESLASSTTEMQDYESIIGDLNMDKEKQRRVEASMVDLSNAFSPRGVQTFVLQNAITSLQNAAQSYLNDFSDGSQRLELKLDVGDRISRRAFVRDGDGDYKERALASLSGGQWRRCSLALNLGFSDLVSRRGQLRPSLCVLDEPLTHLDRTGRSNVGHVLRHLLRRNAEGASHSLSVSTIILILQDLTAEELEESFDCIDEVVKKDGSSRVVVDEGA